MKLNKSHVATHANISICGKTFKMNLICRDHYGNSPLHLAAQNGYTQTIKSLLGVHSHILNNMNADGVCIPLSELYYPTKFEADLSNKIDFS